MKVYLAYEDVKHEGREVKGVFSSLDSAISFLKEKYGADDDGRLVYPSIGVAYYVVAEEVKQ